MTRHRSALPALMVAVVLVGCSSQAEDRTGSEATAGASARDLQLMEAPGSGAAQAVSDLEAGRRAAPTVAPRRQAPPAPAPTESAPEPVPTVAAPEPEVQSELVAAPVAAPADEEAPQIERAPAMHASVGGGTSDLPAAPMDGWMSGAVGGHGPVIIRGGRGGIHDDCDIHRPRGRFGGRGIAINRPAGLPVRIR